MRSPGIIMYSMHRLSVPNKTNKSINKANDDWTKFKNGDPGADFEHTDYNIVWLNSGDDDV